MKQRLFGVNLLTCMIIITDSSPMDSQLTEKRYFLDEVSEIQITDSYQQLINKATITLPRGAILASQEVDSTGERYKKLYGSNPENSIFQRGQRVTIYLGYDGHLDPNNNKKMFDGFIVSVESGNPFKLYCEDMGYALKKNAVKPYSSSAKGVSLNEIAPILLEGTGLKLHPLTKRMDIQLGQVLIQKSKSAAEVLSYWKKWGLLSFIKYYQGEPHLAVSRTFFSLNEEQTLIGGENNDPPLLDFQECLVSDDLKFTHLDLDTLALTGQILYPDNSQLRFTLIRDKAKPDSFNVVNETKLSKKEIKKLVNNTAEDVLNNYANTGNPQDKLDLSTYNVRTLSMFNKTREEGIKEAKSYFNKISQTGIEGTFTIFGDFGLQSATKIRIVDRLNPERNGTYVVSDVKTTFGTKGYRQVVSIPYRLSDKN